jgi:hypothetical protein
MTTESARTTYPPLLRYSKVVELASRLGVGHHTIRKLISGGQIERLSIGGGSHHMYRRDDVLRTLLPEPKPQHDTTHE